MSHLQRNVLRGALLLAVLLLLQLNFWHIWISHGGVSIGCDVFSHLNNQLTFDETLRGALARPSLSAAADLLWSDTIAPAKWPRFTYLVTSATDALLGGGSRTTAMFTNAVFTGLALLGLFSMGRRLYGPAAALLGCALFTFIPFTAHYATAYGLDYPLACMVILCWAVLLRSDGFRSRRWALIFAGAAVLTVMTKLQGVFFLAGPVALVLYQGTRGPERTPGGRRAALVNFGLCAGLAGGLLLALLAGDLDQYRSIISIHIGSSGAKSHSQVREAFGLRSLVFYPLALILGVGPWVFIPAVAGLARRPVRRHAFALVALLTPLAVFMFIFSTKWERFLLPVTPLLCLLAAQALLEVKRPPLRNALVAAVILLTAGQSLFSLFVSNPYEDLQNHLTDRGFFSANTYPQPPVPSNHHVEAAHLARVITQHYPTGPVGLGIVEDPTISPGASLILEYWLRLKLRGRQVTIRRSGLHPTPFFRDVRRYNAVVVLSRGWAPPPAMVRGTFAKYSDRKLLAKTWPHNTYDYGHRHVTQWINRAARWPAIGRAQLRPERIKVLVLAVQRRRAPRAVK